MRWKVLAGAVAALAWLAPAVPAAAAEPAQIGLSQACRLGQPVSYPDLRPLLDVDVDAMTDSEVRVKVNQILAASKGVYAQLPGVAQDALDGKKDGPEQDTRNFLKSRAQPVWHTDVRILTVQTINAAGPHLKEAVNKVLDDGSIGALLGYLNDGQHTARAQDYRDLVTEAKSTGGPEVGKAATAALAGTFEDLRVFLCSGWLAAHDKDQVTVTPTPTPTPASTPTPAQTVTPGGPTLPVTGTNTMVLLIVGASLVVCGVAGVVLARRRRA
ncbi:LPXTG cell wall anchor domain-containing protein [Catellatospora citrea]|nr:LPXTG cell wall anchor domain-containing protein [Catellatospora citrea]RKE09213.1 LPXTG-motif cell wall-anchored protein [Catellatospora citrea]